MDDLPDGQGQSDTHSSDPNGLPEHKLQSNSLAKQERGLDSADSSLNPREVDHAFCASQALWSTGSLSSSIPNGFYSIIPVSWILLEALSC
jgi:hypothetical protein